MKLSANKKEQSNVDKQIAELQEMLKSLESKKQSLVQDESKINAVINNNKSLLANPDFFIECMEKNEKLFAGVVRKEYNIDSSIPDTTIISVLRTRIYDLNSSKMPKSGDDIMKEVDEESKRSGIKNPFSCLKDFEFNVCEYQGYRPRRRTPSSAWNFYEKNGLVLKMSEPDKKNFTDKYFNHWTLLDVMNGVKFLAADQESGELFYDTLNTLNPNVVSFKTLHNSNCLIVANDGINITLYSVDKEFPYFNLEQYLQTLILCACTYFKDFNKYLIDMVAKFESVDLTEMLKDPKRKGFVIFKCFKTYINPKDKFRSQMLLTCSGSTKLVFTKLVRTEDGKSLFNKASINEFLDKVLRSVYPAKDVENFYNRVEFFGVFDEVAQGKYAINKGNSFNSKVL